MKKKIDNRATCKKLDNYFDTYKIKSGNDVKKVFNEIIQRTGYGILKEYRTDFVCKEGNAEYLFFIYELVYPNSKIKVTLNYDERYEIENLNIQWTGQNKK